MYWVSVHSLALLVFIFWIFNVVWKKLILSERAIKEDLPLYKLSPVSTTTRKCKLSSSTMTDQPKAKHQSFPSIKPTLNHQSQIANHIYVTLARAVKMRFNEFLVLLVFILLDLQTGAQAVFSKKRREVSWWIWDYYPLQSITEKYASSDFQLRATMEQYKHDLSGHNLALRIQNTCK